MQVICGTCGASGEVDRNGIAWKPAANALCQSAEHTAGRPWETVLSRCPAMVKALAEAIDAQTTPAI
jgi:hypothetical protein